MPLESLKPAQDLLDSLRSLPWAAHGIAIFALLTGLLLWLHGRRLLKPMIVAVFALAGATVGFALPSLTSLGDLISVHAGLIIGAAFGAIIGLLLFRFAMAISLGLVLACIAPVVCLAFSRLPSTPPDATPLSKEELLLRDVPQESDETSAVLRDLAARRDRLHKSIQDAAAQAADPTKSPDSTETGAETTTTSDQFIRTATQRVRAFADALAAELTAQWNELPSRLRFMILGSASLGLGLGIVLGLLLPKWTSGAVTAMLGAAVWLPAAAWLLTAAGFSITDRWHPSATQWLGAWAVASFLGTLIQWRGLKSRKQRAAVVVVKQAT